MVEGKLTLPVIYALNSTDNKEMLELAYKVKDHTVTDEEVAQLVQFTKESGGINYAYKIMDRLHEECMIFIDEYVTNPEIKKSITAYLDYVSERSF